MRKKIKDFPNYEVDINGNIFSMRDNRGGVEKIRELKMKLNVQKNGYVYIGLKRNKKNKNIRVHRIVAEAFILNPLNKLEVNHIDGNKTNNNIKNLEWVTKKENEIHARKYLPRKIARAWLGKIGKDHCRSKAISQYDKKGKFIKKWNAVSTAARATGLSRSNISANLTGQSKSCGGYIWKYTV